MSRLVPLGLAVAFAVSTAPGVQAMTPTGELQGFFASVSLILEDPDLDGRHDERVAAIRAVTRQIFDFDEAAELALGRAWQERSEVERTAFTPLYADLLDRAFMAWVGSRAQLVGGVKVSFLGESVSQGRAVVRSTVLGRTGQDVSLDYHLVARGERWAVRDVVIDGVSLAANYRAQFTRVIQASSYAGLVAQLRDMASTPVGATARPGQAPDDPASPPGAGAQAFGPYFEARAFAVGGEMHEPFAPGSAPAVRSGMAAAYPASVGNARAGAAPAVPTRRTEVQAPSPAGSPATGAVRTPAPGAQPVEARPAQAAAETPSPPDRVAVAAAAPQGPPAPAVEVPGQPMHRDPAPGSTVGSDSPRSIAGTRRESGRADTTGRATDAAGEPNARWDFHAPVYREPGGAATAAAAKAPTSRPARTVAEAPRVASAASGSTQGVSYWVQVAALKSVEGAIRLVEGLRRQWPGKPAGWTVLLEPGPSLARVRVGPFTRRAEATEQMHELEAQGFKPFIAREAGSAR